MSIPIEELQSALTSVQQELARVRQRLAELEQVVSIQTDHEGVRRVRLSCQELTLHPADDPGWEALSLHAGPDGGQLCLRQKEGGTLAAELSLDQQGEPQLLVLGRDEQPRVSLFLQEDCGLVAVHSADGKPGALMRAQPRGGSVAVLQADGSPRGVLVHDEGGTGEDGTERPSATDLLLANGEMRTSVKLHSDGKGGLLSLGPPGQPDALALISQKDGPAIIMHSPDEKHGVTLLALEGGAQVCAHQGKVPGVGFEAHMAASDNGGSSFSLRGDNCEKTVDISALDMAGCITLHDREGDARVMLAHHHGSHSALTLQSKGDEDGVRMISSADVSSLELISPTNPDTKLLQAVTAEKPVVIVQKEKRPLMMFGEGDQGGVVCAYGHHGGQAGIATLSGGPVTGTLLLSTADGTPQLTLDATDHGGRVLINNDLGFQRVALGVYHEGGGLHLNNTGSIGLQAMATARGGLLIIHDSEGHVTDTLPEDTDDGSHPDWGRLPDGF